MHSHMKKLKLFIDNKKILFHQFLDTKEGFLIQKNRFLHSKKAFSKEGGTFFSLLFMISFCKSSSLVGSGYSYKGASFLQVFM